MAERVMAWMNGRPNLWIRARSVGRGIRVARVVRMYSISEL